MENYIMLDGQKFELDNALVGKLRATIDNQKLENEKKRSPFKRQKKNLFYYFVDTYGRVCEDTDGHYELDDTLYKAANYCTDKNLMHQRALYETLNRLLWRFSMENGEGENSWNGINDHYEIYWSCSNEGFDICRNCHAKSLNAVYFPTRELAMKAIDEIIKPFMAKHLDFTLCSKEVQL